MVTLLAMVAAYGVLLILFCLAGEVANAFGDVAKVWGSTDDRRSGAHDTYLKNIEVQLQAIDFSPKDKKTSAV
ncbi:hypothetical protein DL769_008360 [Monosporascus sp. CRB-8-3]|nr:hypothetical protein DL769_008360 [Monosporascus sp. CRB-8-3]